jgi:hypothetical protein
MTASDVDIVKPDLAFIALYAAEDDIIGDVARSEPDRTLLQCPKVEAKAKKMPCKKETKLF